MTEQNTAERWKPAPAFPAYEISDQGRIRRSAPSMNGSSPVGRIIKPWRGIGGMKVSLRCDGQTYHVVVRELQRAAFGDVPEEQE